MPGTAVHIREPHRRSSGRRCRRFVSVLAAFAVIFAGLALSGLTVPASAKAGPLGVKGVILEWKGNLTTQMTPDFGGSIYFSAGVSKGDEASYSAQAGNVTILHRTPGGVDSVATYATRAAFIPAGNTQLVRLSGGEGLFEEDGSAVVTWDGAWGVNFYGGIIPFTMSDPRLIVDADGSAVLRADMSGYTAPISDPTDKTPSVPMADVVVASFASGVVLAPDGQITITPDYAGVEVDTTGGATQNRVVSGWGSWPQTFVNFHLANGLSSHWYSSGSASRDPRKPPYPITVDFRSAQPASIIRFTTPTSVMFGRKKLATKPMVWNSSGRPVTLSIGSDGVCTLINKGKFVRFDGAGTCVITGTSAATDRWAAGDRTAQIQVTKAPVKIQRFTVTPKAGKPDVPRTLRVVIRRVSSQAKGDLEGTVSITDEDGNVVTTIVIPPGSTKRSLKLETTYDTTGMAQLTSVKVIATYDGNDTYRASSGKAAQFRVKKA